MTSELTLLVLRLAFLAALWIFVFSVIYSLRSDLFGTRSSAYKQAMEKSRQQVFASADSDSAPAPAAPAPVRSQAPSDPTEAVQRPSTPVPSASARSERPSKLVITSGPKRGTELTLRSEPLSIGRSGDSDLVIQDDYSSTHHARLLLWNDAWMVQDLDSTNGTYVNGKRVSQPTHVPIGTPVRIGTTTFELR
ncbi:MULTISPECIES: FHA domain-containing protein FhaB/FipA [unclassified Pseudoclavibacter]|uniref:FHA domain-containing protein FhaB/FipA n=1 Tax=unclassified Pseudoclavibacter TaxID=2615177 RepID=UPI000CE88E12|nr:MULTISPECIES: FHA domain-containing protein [unclassified Pseudoclavibacter]MBS3179062.1 FHA domain-containing protein [Pseudoclavibacter sp. Marseille-Q4354]PPG32183.1 FHA domain-containing protein [Pseudoclavibacter sp. RFBB5]